MKKNGGVLADALSALAEVAGAGLVSAMATDGWQAAKTACVQFFGRDGEERAAARLERTRQELVESSGTDFERRQAEQSAVWRARFEDVLENDPAREADLRALVEALARSAPAVSGPTQVNASASGSARQGVQGHGVQVNHFGDPR